MSETGAPLPGAQTPDEGPGSMMPPERSNPWLLPVLAAGVIGALLCCGGILFLLVRGGP